MKKWYSSVIIIGLIIILTQSMCSKDYLITESLDDHIYYRNGYTFSYNETYEQPNWVFYVIKPSDLKCEISANRKDNFKIDEKIITGSATLEDYNKSGYDRGHLKPSADESCDQIQMDETFLMSNMSPQVPGFNRGVWKNLESHIRTLALTNDSLYIYTAGNLKQINKLIGPNKVGVPTSYYKIIFEFKNGNTNITAYLIPNNKTNNSYTYFLTSIDKIQAETGILFPKPKDTYKFPKIYAK